VQSEETEMTQESMTYKAAGVDYDAMDPFKRMAQLAAASTDGNIERFGFKVVPWTRGESVFVIETPWCYLSFVVEGLGTKNLVADAMYDLAAKMHLMMSVSYYAAVGQCNAAMAFNDMITLGTHPLIYGQYVAAGSADWFKNEKVCSDLIAGTRHACDLARCVWGPGETPTLVGIIVPGASDLAGATMGIAHLGQLINPNRIQHGDAIYFLGSSGIHANGLSLARKIASKLPKGYLTELPDGRTYGETLLDPTEIYAGFVEDCLNAGVDIRYAVNITGHGWRKLMRAPQPFAYVIDALPWQLPIFDFIVEHGPVTAEEAYGNLNMGAGFALYVAPEHEDLLIQVHMAGQYPELRKGGHVERSSEKKVVIRPKGIEFAGSTLGVR
jgi:phosphoribosylformylglycinamidine cyclo-ligase